MTKNKSWNRKILSEYFSLTPEKESEMIERIARFIAKSDIRDFLKVALKTYGLTNFFGTIGFLYAYPFATGLLGDFGQEFTELMGINPVGSSQRILQRVEALEEEERRAIEEGRVETETDGRSLLRRIFSFFKG